MVEALYIVLLLSICFFISTSYLGHKTYRYVNNPVTIVNNTVKNEEGETALFKTSVPMFYINLDSSKDRRRYMEKAFNNTGKLIRVRAVDERSDMLVDYISSESGNLNKALASCHCTRSELALNLSHILAVNEALVSGAPAAVILQDDASPIGAPFWTASLDEVVEIANRENIDWQLIWLGYTTGKKNGINALAGRWKRNPLKHLLKLSDISFGGVAYMISRDGMRFLIDNFMDGDDKVRIRELSTHCKSTFILGRSKYCKSTSMLKSLNIFYHKIPPMFTFRIDEDSTGVRTTSPQLDDDDLRNSNTAHSLSWMLLDYELKKYFQNPRKALGVFDIHLWTAKSKDNN